MCLKPGMSQIKPRSLVRRFSVAFALVTFALVGFSMSLAYLALIRNLNAEDDAVLMQLARAASDRFAEGRPPAVEDERRAEAVLIRVIGADGKVVIESPGMARIAPRGVFPGDKTPGIAVEITLPEGATFRGLTLRNHGVTIQAAMDHTHEVRLLARHRKELALILLVATILAALLGRGLATRGLAPLSALAREAGMIRPETLGMRLDLAPLPLELAGLAMALNETLGRLETAFARLSGLASDLAHELRTPLHGLRLELERLATRAGAVTPETMGGLLEQLHHMETLVEQMIFLARTEDPAMVIVRCPLSTSAELAAACAPFEAWGEEAGVRLIREQDMELQFTADPVLLRRALHNLLANALHHTPAGGEIRIGARRGESGVEFEIKDTGEGISSDVISHLGGRFHRPDPSRSRASGGMGLGLAIVKGIMNLHGGRLELASEPGRGTTARLIFPR